MKATIHGPIGSPPEGLTVNNLIYKKDPVNAIRKFGVFYLYLPLIPSR